MSNLLTRDEFRKQVFERDHNRCVGCGNDAKDAHHIMERRLWKDGGYYLDNGASLCLGCHLEAESTVMSCETLRRNAGITTVLLPEHLYDDVQYDKWANVILANGQRVPGELFDDPSVQKIIAPMLHKFVKYMKYPRTYHLPWSPGLQKDDRQMTDISGLADASRVVVSLKMDGENTTMYNDYIHARSVDSENHPTRNWVRNFHAKFKHDIPEGFRICGENLYARHSIAYDGLLSYFLVFGVWNKLTCLSWRDTLEWCDLLDLITVPVIYEGKFNEEKITEAFKPYEDRHEGYVVRVAGPIHYGAFRKLVGKYVRKNHVQTHGHWMREKIVRNEVLKNDYR